MPLAVCSHVWHIVAVDILSTKGFASWQSANLLTQVHVFPVKIQSDTQKRELLKNPTKIEEIKEKKFIDRN